MYNHGKMLCVCAAFIIASSGFAADVKTASAVYPLGYGVLREGGAFAWEVIGEVAGATTAEAPSIVALEGEDGVDVLICGSDGKLARREKRAGAWKQWTSEGVSCVSTPRCASWGRGHLQCFERTQAGGLRWIARDHGIWGTSWKDIGGNAAASPSVTTWGSGRLDAFVRGPNGNLHYVYMSRFHWKPWQDLGIALGSDPGCSSWRGRLDCFARDAKGVVWWTYYDYKTEKWVKSATIGGKVKSAPSAVVLKEAGAIAVFAVGDAGTLQTVEFHNGRWGAWSSLPGGLAAPPSCVAIVKGHVECVAPLNGH